MLKVLIVKSEVEDAREASAQLFEENFLQETGLVVRYKDVARGVNGKPMAVQGWHFNLSHSGPYWAMALSDEVEVGIDIEQCRELRPQMARRILAPGERVVKNELLRNWVLKEAYAKMTGKGLMVDFRTVRCGEIRERYKVGDYSEAGFVCYVVCEK